MGCYGIGVSRVVAACIEQNNDGDGSAFPRRSHRSTSNSSALDPKNADTAAKADELYGSADRHGPRRASSTTARNAPA